MTIHFGAVPASSVLPVYFTSYDANGASVTMTGLAITDVEIYKGISITQRASDAGIVLIDTDGTDVDTVTGFHGFSIDLGDNTDAGFYAVGSFYTVLVSAVTISAQTVSFIAATFRIVAAEAIAGKPKVDVDGWLGTAASTPTVAGVPNVNAKTWNDLATVALPLIPTTAGRTLDVSAGGEAGIDWANVGTPGSTVGLSATTVGVLTAYTGNTPQTGDSFARIGLAGAGLTNIDLPNQTMDITGNLSGSVGSVIGAVGSVTGAVGSVTGNVGGNVVGSVASVTAGVTLAASAVQAIWDALTSALTTVGSIGKLLVDNVNATISSRLATAGYTAPDNTTITAIAGYVDTEVAAILAAVDTEVAAIKAKTDLIPAAPAAVGDVPTAAVVAAAVWNEALSGHQTIGTAGRNLTLAGTILSETTAAGVPTTTTLQLTAGSSVNEFYTDLMVIPASGALAGQARTIASYVGATKTITVDEAWTSAPAAGDAILIRAQHTHSMSQITAAVWAYVTEGTTTAVQAMRGFTAVLLGKLSGGGTATEVIRDIGDTKDRVTATVDASGNRTAITRDLT